MFVHKNFIFHQWERQRVREREREEEEGEGERVIEDEDNCLSRLYQQVDALTDVLVHQGRRKINKTWKLCLSSLINLCIRKLLYVHVYILNEWYTYTYSMVIFLNIPYTSWRWGIKMTNYVEWLSRWQRYRRG